MENTNHDTVSDVGTRAPDTVDDGQADALAGDGDSTGASDGSDTSPGADTGRGGRDAVDASDQDGAGPPKPDPALLALADALADRGMSVEYDADAGAVRAERFGEQYRIHPDGTIDGDGALRDRLADVVDEVVS